MTVELHTVYNSRHYPEGRPVVEKGRYKVIFTVRGDQNSISGNEYFTSWTAASQYALQLEMAYRKCDRSRSKVDACDSCGYTLTEKEIDGMDTTCKPCRLVQNNLSKYGYIPNLIHEIGLFYERDTDRVDAEIILMGSTPSQNYTIKLSTITIAKLREQISTLFADTSYPVAYTADQISDLLHFIEDSIPLSVPHDCTLSYTRNGYGILIRLTDHP